jgi:hypothetical protein
LNWQKAESHKASVRCQISQTRHSSESWHCPACSASGTRQSPQAAPADAWRLQQRWRPLPALVEQDPIYGRQQGPNALLCMPNRTSYPIHFSARGICCWLAQSGTGQTCMIRRGPVVPSIYLSVCLRLSVFLSVPVPGAGSPALPEGLTRAEDGLSPPQHGLQVARPCCAELNLKLSVSHCGRRGPRHLACRAAAGQEKSQSPKMLSISLECASCLQTP